MFLKQVTNVNPFSFMHKTNLIIKFIFIPCKVSYNYPKLIYILINIYFLFGIAEYILNTSLTLWFCFNNSDWTKYQRQYRVFILTAIYELSFIQYHFIHVCFMYKYIYTVNALYNFASCGRAGVRTIGF